ncbi:MAG: Tryptophan 2,3-dioxygenase [Gemmatimonadaceae bacterium]|nr:Tryptophan 2,3-dioxygenase [Gemmatimonadaceae bacterium]
MSASNDVTYGEYLAVERLLQLQLPRSRPEHPDELLFIVVHQASELWFKVLLHELDLLVARLEASDAMAALASMRRINAITRIVATQLSSLDTLPPQRFAEFRGYLGSASGGQSVQFRAIEAASGLRDDHFLAVLREHGPIPDAIQRILDRPTLQALFMDLLAARGTTLDAVYANPSITDLYFLAESLIEYEQGFGLWRFLHMQLVERIIGPMTSGTGGTLGSKYLQRTLSQRFFPKLWEVRSRFFGTGSAMSPNSA